MLKYTKENRGTIFFNLALVALLITSLLAARFPYLSIWFVSGAAILAVSAPLIAARLDMINTKAACEEGMSPPASADVKNQSASAASGDLSTALSSGLFQATREALRGQVHPDAYSRLVDDLVRQVNPSVEIEVGSTKENFAVTLNIINVYIGGATKKSGSEVGGKMEFILHPDLVSELYSKHGAVH